MKVQINKLPKAEIEMEGEIPFSDLEVHKEKALKKLSQNLNLPGFRKGHIPPNVAIEKIGEINLLNEMAEMALGIAYPKIIIDNKIDPIAHPQITITKIATGNPLGFKIKVPVMPDLELPDYKKIAREVTAVKEDIKVEKEDIQKVIDQVLDSKKDKRGLKPELSDELVKTLGDFDDLKDFNQKVLDGVRKEKEWRAKEKVRVQMMEKIITETKTELPEIIIESELDKMIAGFKGDIERMGLKTDEYLKNNNKTIEGLRAEWRSEAEKRGKSQLVLNKIAVNEKIYPKASDVEKEAKHLMEHHKDARPNGQQVGQADTNRVKVYVETVLTNEGVMSWLESGAKESKKESIESKEKEE
jgi:FKBP-type peptidyl-prolyl cis-trans isomerase (trigger factor)